MVFHTFFGGRFWEIYEGRYMMEYQQVVTFVICYVIRVFFSGKIEQAPKSGGG